MRKLQFVSPGDGGDHAHHRRMWRQDSGARTTAVPQAAAPTEAPQAAAPTEAPKAAEPYVGFVPPALTSPFHVAMVDGATARSKELGYKIDVRPGQRRRLPGLRDHRSATAGEGRPGDVDQPDRHRFGVTAVKAANEKGVPILAHNFITPFSEGKVESYIGYDQWGGAEKLARPPAS